MTSVDQQHLINPATVTLTEVNFRDSEDILGRNTLYAPNQTRMTRNLPADSFYQIGKTVKITPPDIRSNGISYFSVDESATLKLKRENALTFRYDTVAPHLRTPILDTDKEILGFSLPGAKVTAEINGKTYTATANEDGYFSLPVDKLSENDTIALKINGKDAGSQTVTKNDGTKDYIVEGTKIVRYLGKGGALTLPVSGNGGTITEIAPFAFAGANLISVILPDSVETIGIGAFMNTGLQSFGWNLQNINSAKLRSIDEYAFRGNEITKVALPELTHRVRTGAFENNSITDLQLGKYTSHVGNRAFKNNKITKVTLADTAEEIGEEAFMNNQIVELVVKDRLPGYEDGLEEIPANAFANNKMSEVSLPKTVTSVDETAFAGNTDGRFIVATDAPEIVPTAGYDVRRSDGTLLKWKNSGNNSGGSTGGGGTGGGSTTDKPSDNGNNSSNGNTTETKNFADVRSGAWYADAVKYVADKGLMGGTGDNKFSPNASTTRGMLMTVLARYAGTDTTGSTPWYQKGMDWAKKNGVSDGTKPTVNITREQLVTMLYRYAGSPAANGSLSDFSDASTVSTYAVNAMQWAVENGIVNGSNGKLNPKNNATRAEVAAILMRFCEMSK